MTRSHLPQRLRTRRHWTLDDARIAFSALASSALTPTAFATREGIDVRRLQRWRPRVEGESVRSQSTPTFIEVRTRAPEPVEVVLRSGRVLRVSETIDATALMRLVDALENEKTC